MKEYVKLFFLELCGSYTIISVLGAIVNLLTGTETNNVNVLVMFSFCLIIVWVLSLHKLFENVSPLVMIIVQYLLSLGLCSLVVLVLSYFIEPVSAKGWFEYFRSFTIPYIFGAGYYYYRVFKDAKEQSKLIAEIQEIAEKQDQ